MNKILEHLLFFFYCIFPCFKKKTNNTETSKDDLVKIVVDQMNDTDENLLMKIEAKRLKGTYNLRSKSIPTRRNLRPRFEGRVVQPGPEEGLRQQQRAGREERLRVAQEERLRERRQIQSRLRHIQQEQSRAHRQEQIQANRTLPPETVTNFDQTMLSESRNEFNGSFLNSINPNNSPDDKTSSMVFTNVNGVNNMRLISSENGEITFQMTFVNEQYKKIDNKVFVLHRVEHFDNRDVDDSDSDSDEDSPIIPLQSDTNRILLQQQEAENTSAPIPLETDQESSPERMDTSEVVYNTAPAGDVDSGIRKTLKRLIKSAQLKPNDLYLCRMKREYDLSGKRIIGKPELFTFKARHHTSNQRLAISANIVDQQKDRISMSRYWRSQRESMDIDPDQNMSCSENQFQNSRTDASNSNLPSTSGSNIFSQSQFQNSRADASNLPSTSGSKVFSPSQFPNSRADASNSNLPSTSGTNIFSQSQFPNSRDDASNLNLPRSSGFYNFPQYPEDSNYNPDSKLPRTSGYISRSKLTPQNQEINNDNSNSNLPCTSGSNNFSRNQLPEDSNFNPDSKLPRASGYISRRKFPQNTANENLSSNLPCSSESNNVSQSQAPKNFNPDSKLPRTNEFIYEGKLAPQSQETNNTSEESNSPSNSGVIPKKKWIHGRFDDLNPQTSTPKTEQNKALKQLFTDQNQATQTQQHQPINREHQALSPVLDNNPTPRLTRSNAFNNLSSVASNTRRTPTNRLPRNQDENQDLNQRISSNARRRDDSDESDEAEEERLASKSKKRKC